MECKSELKFKEADDSSRHLKRNAVKESIGKMPNELQLHNKSNQKYSKEEQVLRPKEPPEAEQLKNKKQHLQQQNAAVSLKKLEARKLEHKKQQEQKALIRKQLELLDQNQKTEMSPKEILRLAERIEAARLRKNANAKLSRQKRNAKFTPEQKEAYRLKTLFHKQRSRERQRAKLAESKGEAYNTERRVRQRNDEYREKLNNAQTPEEKNALRLEYKKEYERRKQERIVLIRRQAEELQRQELKKELSEEEKEILRLAAEIEARRLRKNESAKKTKEERTPEEMEAYRIRKRMTSRLRRQRRRNEKASRNGCLIPENYATSDVPLVVDEIKTEKEVLQETTIKTFRTESLKTAFRKCRSQHYTKIDRRKRKLREYFSCIKELIDAIARPDALSVFGKHIAHMLRTSQKNRAEVDSAKLRIDGILQNLIAGFYSSKTENYLWQYQ